MSKRNIERFWSKTQPATDGSGCILWTASKCKDGYGRFSTADKGTRSHRWIIEQHLGVKLSTEQHVLHSCDTPACVNVKHLRVGTNVDNIQDMVDRRRQMFGARNNKAKITYGQAEAIRRRYSLGGITQSALGAVYGIDQRTVSMIVRGRYWTIADITP